MSKTKFVEVTTTYVDLLMQLWLPTFKESLQMLERKLAFTFAKRLQVKQKSYTERLITENLNIAVKCWRST